MFLKITRDFEGCKKDDVVRFEDPKDYERVKEALVGVPCAPGGGKVITETVTDSAGAYDKHE